MQKQQPLNVQCPSDNDEIRDICIVQLKTLIPGHTDTSISSQISDSSVSNSSTNIMGKIIPQAAHKKASTISEFTGTNCERTLIPNEKFHSVDQYNFSEEDETEAFLPPHSQATQVEDEISQDVDVSVYNLRTPLKPISDIISSRAKRSTKKSRKSSVTVINLPSGKSLMLSYNPKTEKMSDIHKQ